MHDRKMEVVRLSHIRELLWKAENEAGSTLANCRYFKLQYPTYWKAFMHRIKRPIHLRYSDTIVDVCADTIISPLEDDDGLIEVGPMFFNKHECPYTASSMLGHEMLHLVHFPRSANHNKHGIDRGDDPVYVTTEQCFKDNYRL